METVSYQFSLLTRLFTGDLSPGREPPNAYARYIAYVDEHYPERQQYYRIQFNQEKDSWHLTDYRPYRFAPLYPASKHSHQAQSLAMLQKLLTQVQTMLGISLDQVADTYWAPDDEILILILTIHFSLERLTLSEARFYYFQHILTEEVERIREVICREAFAFSTEEATQLYIHKHQQSLLDFNYALQEKISKHVQPNLLLLADRHTLRQLDRLFLEKINELYHFLKTEFPSYFNLDLSLPDDTWLSFTACEKEKIVHVEKVLLECLINDQLTDIALIPVRELIKPNYRQLTHRKLDYCKHYIERLYALIQSEQTIDKHQLIIFMEKINFNHPSFVNYCTNSIRQAIEEQETNEEPLHILWYYFKHYQQILNIAEEGYDFQHLSLPAFMINWLQAEICFQEQISKLKQSYSAKANDFGSVYKIETTLSVAELAYLSRIFYEMGIFTNEQQKDMLRVVARNFSSVKQTDISLQSLYTKYYNTEDATRQAVKLIAERIIRYVERI